VRKFPSRLVAILSGSVASLLLLSVTALFTTGCEDKVDPDLARSVKAQVDMEQYETIVQRPDKLLTLADARKLAIKNSIDQAMRQREIEVRKELSKSVWFKLLPSMKVDFDRSIRSQVSATNSRDLETGEESLATNFSNERRTRTYGINTMWNLLDFGITYFQAKQAEGRVVISERNFQRTCQNLALDVTKAYWRCAVAEQAYERAKVLLEKVNKQEAQLAESLKTSEVKRNVALSTQKQLIGMQRKLNEFIRGVEMARGDLARVLGLRPDEPFKLESPEIPMLTTYPRFIIEKLEEEAVLSRPELFQEDVKEKISRNDVHIAMLKLLPSPSIVLKHRWDRNPHLYANYWYELGAKAAYDFLRIPMKLRAVKGKKLEAEMVRMRRMATAIGILSQLRLAVIEYHAAAEQPVAVSEIHSVHSELLEVTEKMVKAGSLGPSNMLLAEAEDFFAAMRHAQAYARMQVLTAQIENTIGRNPDQLGSSLATVDESNIFYDPYDIENLPSLAEVAQRMAYTKYDIAYRAKQVLLGAGEPGAAAALNILNSVDDRARIMATQVVRENGSARVVAGLLPALTDANHEVRYHASLALREAFAQNFGYYHKAVAPERQAAIDKWHQYLFAAPAPEAEPQAQASEGTVDKKN
jgi:outer membrane protein TolC